MSKLGPRRRLGVLAAVAAVLMVPSASGGAPAAPVLLAGPGSQQVVPAATGSARVSPAVVARALYVDWSDTAPAAGQRTTVRGVFGPATPGQTVVLERRASATQPWRRLAARQASVSGYRGRFSFALRHDRGGRVQYRVRALALGSAPAVASSAATVRTVPQRAGLTVSWSTGVAAANQTGVRVTGQVAGPRDARPVLLQVRRGGRWAAASRATTRSGTYRVAVPTAAYGRYRYRLVAPATPRQRSLGLAPQTSVVKDFVVRPRWTPGVVPPPPLAPAPAPAPKAPQVPALGDASDFTLFYDVARWNPCTKVTYRVNATYGPPSALADTHGAVERIEQATGLDLVHVGSTALVPQANDGAGYPADTQIVVAWASRAQSAMITDSYVAGVGGPMGYGGRYEQDGTPTIQYTRGVVVLNSAYNASLPAGFGTGTTVGKLVMHELGHVVGLNHAAGTTQVMYPSLQKAYPAVWGAGDLTGLAVQGAARGCIYDRYGKVAAARAATDDVAVVSDVVTDTTRELAHP